MILYHGSTVAVEKPEIRESDAFLDFGKGFYTTTSYEQAERWARIKMRRANVDVGYVSIYEFDFDKAKLEGDIFIFENADKEWLDFVVGNRRGDQLLKAKDLHIVPVADDTIYRTIRLFETGFLEVEETVKRLRTETLQNQWAFRSSRMLSQLQFVEAKEIKGDK